MSQLSLDGTEHSQKKFYNEKKCRHEVKILQWKKKRMNIKLIH